MNRYSKPKDNTLTFVIIGVVICCFCCIISSAFGGVAFIMGESPASTPAPKTSSTSESSTSASSKSTATSKSTDTSTSLSSKGCVQNWKYQRDKNSNNLLGPYQECTKENSEKDWCMLPAYISGGKENIAWKYTDDENDNNCLTNWTYYDDKGNVIESNIKRTTKKNSDKMWCGLKVYVTGGPENKAWKYC